jgi:putative ABC transport system permease protein
MSIRYAFRSLLRSPGFTAVVVLTLAIGISAGVTMFSLMRAVLWRPLPYPDPDRIVAIEVYARNVRAGATRSELLGLRERSRSLEQVSTIEGIDANLEYAGEMEHLEAASASDDFLPLLGAHPVLGRMLDSRIDGSPQQPHAILISDDLWHRRFGADRGVIGRAARINGLDMQIAGVLPPGFHLFLPPSLDAREQVDIWLPAYIDSSVPYRGVPLAARLRPGVTLDQANAELQMLAAQFERERPDFYSGPKGWQASPFDRGRGGAVRFTARPLHDDMTRAVRPALFLLAAAVAFVLLIACANAANLMLARGSARQRELEIRRALGAGKIQIVRPLLSESAVLAFASAGIGLFCANFALEAIGRLNASHIPLQSRMAIDVPVALFALLLSVVTTLLFGLLPAWRLASVKTASPLRSGRAETAGSGARRLQRILVVAEVALSIAPLACAGLMLRSFLNLMHSPLGFHPENVMTARIPLDIKRYPDLDGRWAMLRDVLDRVRTIPGVQSVSAANTLPLARTGDPPRRARRSAGYSPHPRHTAIRTSRIPRCDGHAAARRPRFQRRRHYSAT